jgi:chromosome segregation ATPase
MRSGNQEQDFTKLQKRMESLRAKRDQAMGALKAEKARLKEEFGFDSVEEARQFISNTTDTIQDLREKIDKQIEMLDTDLTEIEQGIDG